MFKKMKNIISVIYTFFKFILIKLFRWNEFSFCFIERFSPSTMINLHRGGKMVLENRISAHSGTKLSVTRNGYMRIGEETSFNYNCILVARKKIEIGRNVTFGPNVIIYDHDHDYRNSTFMNGNKFKEADIIIGNNVWIGANSIILKGSEIGDNSVIAAGTLVRGKIESNTIAYNKRELSELSYKRYIT